MKAAKGKWTPYEPLNPKFPFRRDHGMCGDPVSAPAPRDHEAGGKWGYPKSPISANYKANQIVEFVVDVTTNHNGWFEFIICDVTKCGGDINESCFKKGFCHLMMREKTPACESQLSKECGPVDEKYPGRWYIPCRRGDHVGEHFMGGPFMRYKLPKGFKTEHAVIQFYWVTANSCNPPGFVDYFKRYPMKSWGQCPGDGGAIGGRNPTLAECGGGSFPEEFWGCADVSVGVSGTVKSAGAPPPMPKGKPVAETTPEPKHSDDAKDDHPIEEHKELETRKSTAVAQEPKPTKPQEMHSTSKPEPTKMHSKPMKQPAEMHSKPKQQKPTVMHSKPKRTQTHKTNVHKRVEKVAAPKQEHAKPPKHTDTKPQHHEDKSHMEGRRKTMKQREETIAQRHATLAKRRATEAARRHTNLTQLRKTTKEREETVRRRHILPTPQRKCQKAYDQCGGLHYKGPTTCCGTRYRCRKLNMYYSQCSRV